MGHKDNLRKLGPNNPNHYRDVWKVIQSLLVHISHQIRPYSSIKAIWEWCCTFLRGIWTLGQFKKLDPNTSNQVQEHTESNAKFSVPHLTSIETSLLHQGHLMVELYLFYKYSGIRAIWGNLVQISQIIWRDTGKVIYCAKVIHSSELTLVIIIKTTVLCKQIIVNKSLLEIEFLTTVKK